MCIEILYVLLSTIYHSASLNIYLQKTKYKKKINSKFVCKEKQYLLVFLVEKPLMTNEKDGFSLPLLGLQKEKTPR